MNSLHWFQIILSLTLQVTFVTAVANAVERRCDEAQVKARIWSCYFLSILGLLLVALLLPRAHWINPWQSLADRELVRVVTIQQSAAILLLTAWLVGSVYFTIRWIVQFFQLQTLLRSCPVATLEAAKQLQVIAPPELLKSAHKPVEFRLCPEEFGPFCYQFHKPAVYLPPSLLRGSPGELQQVLQHELTHLQTEHPMQVFTQRVAQTLLWFIPGVWRAGRRATLAREFVCDDAAVGHGSSPASYLRTLLRFALRPGCGGAAVLAIARSPSELRIRAERLAKPDKKANGRLGLWAPSVVLFASLIASQAWLPTNPLASPKSHYSPWPVWSASALYAFDISVRDFDQFDSRLQIYELSKND